MLIITLMFLVILLLTAYLATQGALSAVMILFSSLFAAVLAMGLLPVTSPMMAGMWNTEYAASAAFLAVYAVAFGGIRLASDLIIPEDIKLPTMINRIGGGVVGLFAALATVGGLMIGMYLMPLPESMGCGYTDDNQLSVPMPVQMVSSILSLANGGGQGGQPLASVYPDLPLQLAGYRHTVMSGSRIGMPADHLRVEGWSMPDVDMAKTYRINLSSSEVPVIVRTVIQKGLDASKTAVDGDNYLRLTPTQVRLVAFNGKEYKQYYPTGDLDHGRTYQPLAKMGEDPINAAIVDDAGDRNDFVHDWVFGIDPDYTPELIEVKQGGIAKLDAVNKTPQLTELAESRYPPRGYLTTQAQVKVAVSVGGTPLKNATVWILRPMVDRRALGTDFNKVHDELLNKQNSYPDAGAKGVPSASAYRQDARTLLEFVNEGPTSKIPWSRILVPMVKSSLGLDGIQNLSKAEIYVRDILAPWFRNSNSIIKELRTNDSGQTPQEAFAPETYVIVTSTKRDDGFYFWVKEQKFNPKEEMTIDMGAPTFTLDLK